MGKLCYRHYSNVFVVVQTRQSTLAPPLLAAAAARRGIGPVFHSSTFGAYFTEFAGDGQAITQCFNPEILVPVNLFWANVKPS